MRMSRYTIRHTASTPSGTADLSPREEAPRRVWSLWLAAQRLKRRMEWVSGGSRSFTVSKTSYGYLVSRPDEQVELRRVR